MTVFVDNLFSTAINGIWISQTGCHVFGPNNCELHDLAHKLGIHPIWYRNQKPFGFYMLTPARRKKALSLGAVELTDEQTENFWKTGYPIFNSDLAIEKVQ